MAVAVDHHGMTASQERYRPVSVGALSLTLGELDARYICLDHVEFIRRLFVAVRDVGWGTAPTVGEDVAVDLDEDALCCSTTALSADPEHAIELRWHGALRCRLDGVVEFAFQATPMRNFPFARIGICVLFPPEFAGAQYEAKTPSGWITGRLEHTIAPQFPGEHGFGEPLFPAFDELRLHRRDGLSIRLRASGDLFELEDQRNWGDASFKAYSTPLHLGPQVAEPGTSIQQRVEITPTAPPSRGRPRQRVSAQFPSLEFKGESSTTVPAIGVVLSEAEVDRPLPAELLDALGLAHLRVDVELDNDAWLARRRQAFAAADSLGVPVELAITKSEDDAQLDELANAIDTLRLPIARVLAFRRGAVVSEPEDVVAIRRCLSRRGIEALVYGGSDTLFSDLNAARPGLDALDGIAFPLVPTVHADDDLSLIETTTVLGDVVRTARTFAQDLPLAITPLTLRQRPGIDERQASLMGAVWSLGALSGLASAGAESVTLFEAVGPAGLLTTTRETVRVYPLYHVIADLCRWRGRRVLDCRVSDPLSVACLGVRHETGFTEVSVANLLPRRNRLRLEGVGSRGLRARRLNETTLPVATSDPIAFRETAEEQSLEWIDLSPYEVIRLEAHP